MASPVGGGIIENSSESFVHTLCQLSMPDLMGI